MDNADYTYWRDKDNEKAEIFQKSMIRYDKYWKEEKCHHIFSSFSNNKI